MLDHLVNRSRLDIRDYGLTVGTCRRPYYPTSSTRWSTRSDYDQRLAYDRSCAGVRIFLVVANLSKGYPPDA